MAIELRKVLAFRLKGHHLHSARLSRGNSVQANIGTDIQQHLTRLKLTHPRHRVRLFRMKSIRTPANSFMIGLKQQFYAIKINTETTNLAIGSGARARLRLGGLAHEIPEFFCGYLAGIAAATR